MKKKPDRAEQLRARMIDRFGSISAFAEETGIDRTQVYPILRGDALPGLRNFVVMSEALALTLDELATILGVQNIRKELAK